MRKLVLITALAALAPCLNAQRIVSTAPRFNRAGHPGSFFYPPTFSTPFFSDSLYSTGYPVSSQPPIIILQSPPMAAPTPDRPSPPSQPLMIELRGDHYVRVSGEEASGSEMIGPETIDRIPALNKPAKSSDAITHATALQVSAPAVLIFRDGHHQEVSDYTIADGALYTRGNYYTDGSWTRKIELSSLNLPDTITANQSRGINFQLPTAPNEVIVRP